MDEKISYEELIANAPHHAEAEALLSLVQYPELLEGRPIKDILRDMKKAGYTKINASGVTIGWGRKVGEPHTHTQAIFLSEDGKLMQFGVGSEGNYFLDQLPTDDSYPDDIWEIVLNNSNCTQKALERIAQLRKLDSLTDETRGHVQDTFTDDSNVSLSGSNT